MDYKDSFSGSKFELVQGNKNIYIKKFYKFIGNRDLNSFEKQKNFKSYFVKKYQIKSAEITKINIIKKLITLKYYSGLSGTELILNSDIEIHKILNIFLEEYVKNLIATSEYEKFNARPYIVKCHEVKKKISPKHIFLFKKMYKKIYSKLSSIQINLRGSCHGDLTLSNIIINSKKKKIILIDFLKTYKESPLQDICKLIQDLRLYWTSRKLNKTELLRAKIFCDNINPFLSVKKPQFLKILDLEMSMTLLRILPYISENDIETMKWLEVSFDKLGYSFYKNI